MKPTTELNQHHTLEPPAVDARNFRQTWRVTSRLDALLRDKRISPNDHAAACAYRNAWERIAAAPLSSFQMQPHSTALGDPHNRQINALYAMTTIRNLSLAIGAFPAALCHACIVNDLPWTEIARRTHRNRETVRDWTAGAIHQLAIAWNRAP